MWGGRRIPFACRLLPAAAFLLAGCLGGGAVVPDLRYREAHAAELRDHLYSGEFAATARHRQDAERSENAYLTAYRPGADAAPPGRLGLSAVAAGPHAEALRVLVQPRDGAGRPDRTAAALQLSVLQATPDGQSTFLGRWDVPADLLAHAWTSNWEGTGYRLVLPWKEWPTSGRVRVVARLAYEDGTCTDAEREVVLNTPASERAAPATAELEGEVRQAQAAVAGADEGRWEPAPLQGAIKVGRPTPLGPDD